MLTNKSLLYGLGTGMIVGALLLQLMNAATASGKQSALPKEAVSVNDLDRQQLKEAASKYFQVFENDQKLYNQAQLDTVVQQKLKEEKEKQPVAAPATPVPASPVGKESYIYITSGLNASNVGDLLVQSGVIKDRAAFEELMNKQQLNQKIVAGVHVFYGTEDLAQVVTNITTRQKPI